MNKKILEQCLLIAKENNAPNLHPQWLYYKHYSFIIQNNEIIDWGTNRKGSAITILGYPNYSKIHSEFDAFRKAKGLLKKNKKFEIINIRLSKTSTLKNSRPCKCCSSYLHNMGCHEVWYTTINGFCKLKLNQYMKNLIKEI